MTITRAALALAADPTDAAALGVFMRELSRRGVNSLSYFEEGALAPLREIFSRIAEKIPLLQERVKTTLEGGLVKTQIKRDLKSRVEWVETLIFRVSEGRLTALTGEHIPYEGDYEREVYTSLDFSDAEKTASEILAALGEMLPDILYQDFEEEYSPDTSPDKGEEYGEYYRAR